MTPITKIAQGNPFRSSKRCRPSERVDCSMSGGAGMGLYSALYSIIEQVLKRIVNVCGSMRLNADDGRLRFHERTSNTALSDFSRMEAKQ